VIHSAILCQTCCWNNVLRGGLTPKHVDVPELLRVLDFDPVPDARVGTHREGIEPIYDTPATEFADDGPIRVEASVRAGCSGPPSATEPVASARMAGLGLRPEPQPKALTTDWVRVRASNPSADSAGMLLPECPHPLQATSACTSLDQLMNTVPLLAAAITRSCSAALWVNTEGVKPNSGWLMWARASSSLATTITGRIGPKASSRMIGVIGIEVGGREVPIDIDAVGVGARLGRPAIRIGVFDDRQHHPVGQAGGGERRGKFGGGVAALRLVSVELD
jgi:hypothetical protein